jgi:hypothetical protein
MSSRSKKIFLILIGLVILFALGTYIVLNHLTNRYDGYAKVTFVNNSNTDVKNVNIITNDSIQIKLDRIEIGDSKIVHIPVSGEGEYKADIFFTNGDTLFCGAYIESGYKITETITDDKIINSTKLY